MDIICHANRSSLVCVRILLICTSMLQQILLSLPSFPQVAGALTLPLDVIKTHRQIELGEEMFSGQSRNV